MSGREGLDLDPLDGEWLEDCAAMVSIEAEAIRDAQDEAEGAHQAIFGGDY